MSPSLTPEAGLSLLGVLSTMIAANPLPGCQLGYVLPADPRFGSTAKTSESFRAGHPLGVEMTM